MERKRRERSRSPLDTKKKDKHRYPREQDKDGYRRKDVEERECTRRSDQRENHRRNQRQENYNPRREEDHGREYRHRSNDDGSSDKWNRHRQDNYRKLKPGRDTRRERIPQRNVEQREEQHRTDGRHDFRKDRNQNDEHRGNRRTGYHVRQRGSRRESDNEPEDSSRYGRPAGEEGTTEAAMEAEKPNFGLSGKLTEYTNTYKGVVIKYNEPPEGRKPKTRWRLYPFKGDEGLPVLYIHRQSAYLLGRQRHIADIPIDHPSCSKQHAVLQYRLANYERPDGTAGRKIKPYIIDLESANGTFLNNQKIEPRRYYELKERDVLKFGFSSREYVILHEKSSSAEEEGTGEPTGSGSGSGSGSESDASAN